MSSRRTSPRKASHDPLFDGPARASFFGRIGTWMTGDALADALEAAGLPRPSQGSGTYRALLTRLVVGREPWQVAELAGDLFDASIHLPGAPVDADGYLDALVADAPALCAHLAAPVHTTHCHGARVWRGEVCTVPALPDSGTCPALEAA